MKKIKVTLEQCIGCGACVAIDPEHFDFDDEGRSNVISNENMENENLTNAIESCPTSAISIVEESCDCGCEDCTCDTNGDCNCDCEECNCEETCNCGCNCECEDTCECDDEDECNCSCCGCHEEEN